MWLWDPMDYSLLGSSVRGILQARLLEWVAIPFSRRSFQPRDQTQVSRIAGGFFTMSHQGSPMMAYNVSYHQKETQRKNHCRDGDQENNLK